MARLANREHDVLRQLREQEDVGDIGVERLLEQGRGLTRGKQDDRRQRVLADGRDLLDGQSRAARGVQDGLQVATGQRAGALADVLRPADELELRVTPEGVTQLGKAFAVARDEDASLFTCLGLDGHRALLARRAAVR